MIVFVLRDFDTKKFGFLCSENGFPFSFPLSADILNVILHSVCAAPLHLFGDMTVNIQGKSSGGMA